MRVVAVAVAATNMVVNTNIMVNINFPLKDERGEGEITLPSLVKHS
jgi:hypothetical protein